MSKSSEELETSLESMVNKHNGEPIPTSLPGWMIKQGVVPGAIIQGAERIGNKNYKTDVIIYLNNSEPIKISAKLLNADYFGNWYGHRRFLQEFGEDTFSRITKAATEWANEWAKYATQLYVGVSISFGKRGGDTGMKFTDIFLTSDILKVAKGVGDGISAANCMYISDRSATDIPDLINNVEEITEESVNKATSEFKVIFRPVDPTTSYSDRGKNIYTVFKPKTKLTTLTTITNAQELFKLGEFVEVTPTRPTHNRVLTQLEVEYNIRIPKKPRTPSIFGLQRE